MPFRPSHSLLRVEVPALHTIDTSSVENLFGMWSLFSKTSHAMEDGKRLENLSWRLWNRETFCCNPDSKARSTSPPRLATSGQPKAATADIPMPTLSSSLDSASSDELTDSEAAATPAKATTIPKARPELRRSNSCESRGREKHITPVDLEKIVISIQETSKLEPIDIQMPTVSTVPAETASTSASEYLSDVQLDPASSSLSTTAPNLDSVTESQAALLESSAETVSTNDDNELRMLASNSSSNTAMSTLSHAISYGLAPSSYRSQTRLAPHSSTPLKTSPLQAQPKKKGAMFTIGTSSGEDESSVESYMHKSTLSENLKRSNLISSSSSRGKQTSFNNEVSIGRAAEHSPVFDSDDEDEEVSESAIEEDDDSSDWEDSDDPSGPSSMNERDLFQRVDSRPNLKSQRSLLTTALHEPDRARALANAASRSTPAIRRSRQSTPNGPSVPTSPVPAQAGLLTHEVSLPKPIIMTTSNTHLHQPASSPRTTRRNMLSSELTESLRKNLLWERQHRSTGNLAAMKKRLPPPENRNLRQPPEQPPSTGRAPPAGWSNEYFHAGLGEYHAKGW